MTWRGFQTMDPKVMEDLDRTKILAILEKNAFRDPDVVDGEVESHGFVVFDEILTTEFDANSEKTFVGSYVIFSYRRDKLKLPSAYTRALIKAEEAQAEEKKGSRLSRAERTAIKERIELMLYKKVIPAIQVADVAWSLTDGTVRIFSGSKTVVETCAELLESCFGVELLPSEPFVRLLDENYDDAKLLKQALPAPIYIPALLNAE
ncbi:MAG: hypothetical protein CMH54_00755 [Myxococcales bacterium]|nr:hypothetical protein [Myxococcales bacterium]|tara:strand:+ start:214 stop:831 length:618 start_codon:yes stop_codon:yes gene_type:complete